MFPIATYSGGGFGFFNIPQTFQHLQLRISARTSALFGGAEDFYFFRVNQDSTAGNYTFGGMFAGSTSGVTTEFDATSNYARLGYVPGGGGFTNDVGQLIVTILDYTSTNKFKQIITHGGNSQRTTGSGRSRVGIAVTSWDSLTAINRLDGGTGNQVDAANTTVSLYGLNSSPLTGA